MKYLILIAITLLCCSRSAAFQINTVAVGNEKILTGKIFDDHLKTPVAASLTIIIDDSHPIKLHTGIDGKFSVPIPQALTCTITARAAGFEEEEETYDLVVDSEKITNIEIYLSPIEKLKMTGMILDKKSGKPLHAEFDLFHDTDIIKDDVKILGEKGYSEIFTKYGWYLIEILSPGYLIETDTIWVMSLNRMELKKDYHLTPIETGMTVQLKNVYFSFETTNLDPDSFAELNNVVDFLKWNPSLKLEIGGHTDSEGADDFNLVLSQGRAQAVVDYLTGQGINKSQLTAVGYGETKPLDKRETKAAKAINRRVEFTVTKYQ